MAAEVFRLGGVHGGEPYLLGSRCRACADVSFPARIICSGCGSEEVEESPVGRRGRVRSSAVVHHAPPGFAAPYVVALVELEEGPLVFCPLAGCGSDEESALPGTAVELVIAPARPGGSPVVQFRPRESPPIPVPA